MSRATRSRGGPLGVALALLGVLAACKVGGADDPVATDGGLDAGLAFTPCDEPLECADLAVPVDPARPEGPKTRLRVARSRALDGVAAGTIVLNPGGPGAPMIERFAAQYGIYKLGFGKALQRFDVVTWDVRGVGQSARATCGDAPLYDRIRAADLALEGPSTTEVGALGTELRAGCLADPLGGHLSTLDTAHDLEAVRRALGVPKILYFGTSYGAVLGLAHASLHPTSVEAFVADAPTVLAADLEADLAAAAAARRVGLERFFAACAARPSCPFTGVDGPAVAARFDALVARSAKGPLPAGARGLSRVDLAFALADGLRVGDPDKLGADLAKAEAGDASALLARADLASGRDAAGRYDGTFGVHVATVCSDQRLRSPDLAAFAAFAAELRLAEPRTGWMVVAPWALCVGWPRVTPPSGGAALPALVVSGRNDPIVPFSTGELLRARFPGARLLVHEGDGHPSSTHSGCVRDAITAFLLDPRSSPPASCPKE